MKEINHSAWVSIGHLPNSRLGTGDHHIHAGQAKLCEKTGTFDRRVYVTEKLDGSCCAVLRKGSEIIPLTRRGYIAWSSPFEQHHWFADWTQRRAQDFKDVLNDGERMCGEWLSQVHSLRYLVDENTVFAPFGIMVGQQHRPYSDLLNKAKAIDLTPPYMCHSGYGVSVDKAFNMCQVTQPYLTRRCLDPIEGVVYRMECKGALEFMAKYVRSDKIDGSIMHNNVFNWRPSQAA